MRKRKQQIKINEKTKKNIKKQRKKTSGITVMFDTVKTRYTDVTDVNGKYYLTKMYVAELFEHIQQVYSLTNIYLCLMPVEISIIVCIVLSVELAINIWLTMYLDSQEIRDRLVLLDILTDIFCIVFPLLYTSFLLEIPVSIPQMLFIVVYPTLSLFSKLEELWRDYFIMDLERIQIGNLSQNTNQTSVRASRRKSILNLSHHHDSLTMQLKYFPKCLRYFFIVINIGFLVFFISLISVHLATQPSRDTCIGIYTKEVWDGCQVTVPYCQALFVAKCDCGMIRMTNYSKNALHASFAGLKSLVRLDIYGGQLEELPQSIGTNYKRLVDLRVMGNRLTLLPDSIGNLQNLLRLYANNNHLISLPDSVGNLQNLIRFHVYNNQLTSLPDNVGNLHNLRFKTACISKKKEIMTTS